MEIQLPDFVLAELYKKELVVINNGKSSKENHDKGKEKKATPMPENTASQKFWLGDNARRISIILNDNKNVFIDENGLQFLTNILSACKFNLSDAAIVNIANIKLNFDEITNALQSRYVLLFGINEEEILLNSKLNLYENKPVNNISVLKSPSLETLMQPTPEAKKEKANLWNALKKMFGL